MKKLDLYIIRKFLGTYVFMIMVVMSISIVFDISEKLSDFMDSENNLSIGDVVFGCTYKRMNQGVLLPNGSVSLCCNDYGLKTILGNLQFDDLNFIYNKIENNPETKAQFSKGEFAGCLGCEHYRDISNNMDNQCHNNSMQQLQVQDINKANSKFQINIVIFHNNSQIQLLLIIIQCNKSNNNNIPYICRHGTR